MTRLSIIIGLFVILSSLKSTACDCFYNGPFYKMAKNTKLVILVKITRYLTFKKIDEFKVQMPVSMEAKIIDCYKGMETRKKITIWGDMGSLCRPYLSTFSESGYYLMALDGGEDGGRNPEEKDSDYSISACGAYWLNVNYKKRIAIGDINSSNMTKTSLGLKIIKSDLQQNSR